MGVAAYVFIETELGKGVQIVERLRRIDGVGQAHAVTGHYDIVAYIEADTMDRLRDLLVKKVHHLQGVVKTTTNMVIA